MYSQKNLLTVLFIFAALALPVGALHAEPYRDPVNGFTLEIPEGWVVMSAAELKWYNAIVHEALPEFDISFVVGLRPANAKMSNDTFMTVHIDTSIKPGISFDELTKDFQADRAASEKNNLDSLLRMGHLMELGKPTFDEKQKRIFSMYSYSPGDKKQVRCNYIHLGPDKLIVLHYMSNKEAWQKNRHLFVNVSDSLKFEENIDSRPMWQQMVMSPSGEIGRPVVVGGAATLGVLVIGVLTLVNRKSRSRSQMRW